jgi:hypothetical protein
MRPNLFRRRDADKTICGSGGASNQGAKPVPDANPRAGAGRSVSRRSGADRVLVLNFGLRPLSVSERSDRTAAIKGAPAIWHHRAPWFLSLRFFRFVPIASFLSFWPVQP